MGTSLEDVTRKPNAGYGVRITTETGNAIRQNAIFGNGAGGIALLNGGNYGEPTLWRSESRLYKTS